MPRIRAENIEAHKVQTRSAIVEAAAKLFVVDGFTGTSLATIADLAGIGRSTIYEYFESKDALLVAIIEDRVPPLLDGLVAQLPDAGAVERTEALFRGAFDLVGAHLELAVLLFRVGRELPKPSRDRLWRCLAPITRELFRVCRQGVESGAFQFSDPELLGQIMADQMVGAVDQVTQAPDPLPALPRILDARIAFVRGGLGAG